LSLFERSKRAVGDTPNNLIPSRMPQQTGSVFVTPDTSLRTSAVWAAQRLRADLISTMPLQVYRQVGNVQVSVPTPTVLQSPGGPNVDITEWLYSSQFELDRTGNAFGIISERDSLGNPSRVDLVDSATVVVRVVKGAVTYRIAGTVYAEDDIWHEKQFTLPGMVMGMSPVSYAAWSIGQFQSAADFGLAWFANGASVPGGVFKNTAKQLGAGEAEGIKTRFKQAVASRDVMVTGSDWEYSTVAVAQNESQFLDTQKFTLSDVARFYGVPGDLIDVAPVGKTAITYASITQRNLQFLIMNLGPVFVRREKALSTWLPKPRFCMFNTDELLRLDPDTKVAMYAAQILSKQRTPSEVRALDNLAPFTPAQIDEFTDLGIVPAAPILPQAPQPETGEIDV
jgi:HK97 family phage portal protein